MSRGLGKTQRAVLAAVESHPDGLAIGAIAAEVWGRTSTAAQLESVRRAVRTLEAAGLVQRITRWDRRPRKSIKRLISITPCEIGLCVDCGQRKKRVRLADWHRKAMRANAKYDPTWLDDLALAEQTGFVHEKASDTRLVDEKPNAVDSCTRRVQFVLPMKP